MKNFKFNGERLTREIKKMARCKKVKIYKIRKNLLKFLVNSSGRKVTPAMLSRIESGLNGTSITNMVMLAGYFRRPVNYFFKEVT